MQKLTCKKCPIKTIDLSKNLELRYIHLDSCSTKTLDLSYNLQLEDFHSWMTPIETLDFSHNLRLQNMTCETSSIRTLDLSHNLQLKEIRCSNNPHLTSLGESLANTLTLLSCQTCPLISQLPQLPATATVYSSWSRAGALNSFKVYPAELEQHPLQILLDLGKILLANKPMPNIVYMDPATKKPAVGVDAGGLRRQFVATLCENLFKEGSHFNFVKDGDYTIPASNDVAALRTFARLLGLGIPTGTNLHPSFFHSLFVLSDEELKHSPLPERLLKKLYMARHGLDHFEESDAAEMKEETNSLTAIAVIAKELRALLGTNYRPRNIDEFIAKVQGVKVTKESLKENIRCANATYRQWIDKFIDKFPLKSGKATYELKHLVMLLTGSYTLESDHITFVVLNREHLKSSTSIHTCSRMMELPGDLDEKLLHEELEAQLKLLKIFNAA